MVNYEKIPHTGASFSETIHKGFLCENDRQSLRQIGEHFHLASETEAVLVAIRQLMPALEKGDRLSRALLDCQNQLELKQIIIEGIQNGIGETQFQTSSQKTY